MLAVVGLSIIQPAIGANAKTLSVPAVDQKLSSWCWLAAAEMVFRYYRVPAIHSVYQCGLAASFFGGPCAVDCRYCNVGSGPVETIGTVITNYPGFARRYTGRNGPDLAADVSHEALSAEDLINEIDADRPVIAGISPHSRFLPPGLSEHAIVIIGYEGSDEQDLQVLVNDPFPYSSAGIPNPYTSNGGRQVGALRFRISYRALVERLAWRNTIAGIDRE